MVASVSSDETTHVTGFHCTECSWSVCYDDGWTDVEMVELAGRHTEKTHHFIVKTEQ